MTTTTDQQAGQRAPLTRDRILRAALRYVDAQGLAGLSMHKLGEELGVKGMSLYNHVANKSDVLDGVVELIWEEVESAAPATTDWQRGYTAFAHALRDRVNQHPNSAPLITAQRIIPEPALRCVQAHIAAATSSGIPEERAYGLLRTLTSYALGTAFNEIAWGTGQTRCGPTAVHDLVRPGVSAELAGVAEIFCGQADPDAQFQLGIDLMLRGLDSTTAPGGDATTVACHDR